ncbi:hypothetical protein BJY01DRAFT_238726 [Aspergillus pseudoustus]|uniref:Amidohydrolase-related domain-containing protein n=1 Tax=Aspergillus pseudoustus TaxID=1810923 RepID=A0ABR4J6M5_9EURO
MAHSHRVHQPYAISSNTIPELAVSRSNVRVTWEMSPSPFKTDCTVLMRCLEELRDQGGRAYALGVWGIRLNFRAYGKENAARAQRIRHSPGWVVIQLFVPGWVTNLGGMLGSSKSCPPIYKTIHSNNQDFTSLIRLAREAKVYVEISGLYRTSTRTTSPFAREIPNQCAWGSDWPHIVKEAFRVIDNRGILANLSEWVGWGACLGEGYEGESREDISVTVVFWD